jgi:uncharacterized protein YicC (UPF0701 family)
MLIIGIGQGLVETVINPLAATLYPDDKTHKLNVLHAWWPGGIIIGGLLGLFQGALAMSSSERHALIHGYRKAGQARGVVHAISQLPRAHGRTLMRDLVIKSKDKSIDRDALHQVLCWLRDAGAEVTRLQKSGGEPRPAREDMDEDVVDFFEDIADDIANAISSVVDAVVNTVKTLGAALSELVNWAANDLANLVKALVEKAGKSVLDLINAALETGYELVKKIVGALSDIGTGLFKILDAAFNLAKDALMTVLKAIDNLGRQMSELLSYLANKAFSVIQRAAEALVAIGKTIGNILQQALEFGIDAKGSTPEELGARLRSDIDKWSKVIERAGVPKQ